MLHSLSALQALEHYRQKKPRIEVQENFVFSYFMQKSESLIDAVHIHQLLCGQS